MTHEEPAALHPVELDAGRLFSGKKSGTVVKGCGAPSSYTPASAPGSIFHEGARDLVVWFLDAHAPLSDR